MRFVISLYKFGLNIIYFFIKLFPTKNQVAFISRQSDKPSIDIELLQTKLNEKYPDINVVVLCKTLKAGAINKIKYFFYIFKMMYYIARSKVVVLDSYSIPISILHHKKNLYVIQMWHAIGLMKKAGFSILNQEEGRKEDLAKAVNMHKNYNLVFASSKECINSIKEVFNVPNNKIKIMLLPRVDLLRNKKYIENKKKEITKAYSLSNKKKNIVYVPTFRKNKNMLYKNINDLIKNIDFNKYNFIIKLHPNSKSFVTDNKNVIIANKFKGLELLTVADYVISDYSAIIYEACILKKPIIYYAFDLDKYEIDRGFFIDYMKEIPGTIIKDANKINKALEKKYDYKKQQEFVNRYCPLNSDDYTSDIINLIREHL